MYIFQVWNSVYGYWEFDTEVSDANGVLEMMRHFKGFKTRYLRNV